MWLFVGGEKAWNHKFPENLHTCRTLVLGLLREGSILVIPVYFVMENASIPV